MLGILIKTLIIIINTNIENKCIKIKQNNKMEFKMGNYPKKWGDKWYDVPPPHF